MRIRLLIPIVLAAAMSGCQQAATEPEASAIRTAIDTQNQQLADCFASGDADCVAGAFTPEGLQLQSNSAPLAGQEAIQRYWGRAMAWGTWEVSFETSAVEQSGPLAIERGRYTMQFTASPTAPPGRTSFEDRGNYVAVWRFESNTRWFIVSQAIVSELPPRVVKTP